ncbi:MAG: hypothetical protein EWM72_02980 [Nitrospira sp.]|nr:MAG: hypothetical protein EWM72_02980 [Nitrospira sp.]
MTTSQPGFPPADHGIGKERTGRGWRRKGIEHVVLYPVFLSPLLSVIRCPLLTLSLVPALFLLAWGCVSPIERLWPPRPNSPSHPIYVSLDTWHAMIAFPVQQVVNSDQPTANSLIPSTTLPLGGGGKAGGEFEEWGYAERAWYIEGRTGLTGVMRALSWPTEGVVEVGRYNKVWAERTPQPPSELFRFHLSEEGYQRVRHHLRTTIAKAEPITTMDGSTFYPAARSYHLFHTCHQYAAHALREAGLPISPFWAFSRSSLAMQLQRAVRLTQDNPAEPAASVQ